MCLVLRSGTFPTLVFIIGGEDDQNCAVANFIWIFLFYFASHSAGLRYSSCRSLFSVKIKNGLAYPKTFLHVSVAFDESGDLLYAHFS